MFIPFKVLKNHFYLCLKVKLYLIFQCNFSMCFDLTVQTFKSYTHLGAMFIYIFQNLKKLKN